MRSGVLFFFFLAVINLIISNFFFFNFKFYFIFRLYITVLVLPNIKMNPPQEFLVLKVTVEINFLRAGK